MSHPVAVFDLDGTLVDAFADIAAAINKPLVARGVPPHTVEHVRNLVGEGVGKLIERATPPELAEDIPAIREEMLAHYSGHPADLAYVYPGVEAVLASLKAEGIRLAVLSNKPHAMAVRTCEEMGLSLYLDAIQGEGGDIPRKPDPGGLRMLLRQLDAGRAVIVGDGLPDGQVAANAGLPFLAVLWGTRTREQLTEQNPVAIAATVAELARMIPDALSGARLIAKTRPWGAR